MEEVSVKVARENFADIVNFVAFGKKNYQINKYGKPVAVVISIDQWNQFVKLSSRFIIVE